MIVEVDLTGTNASVTLVDPEDCTKFHVKAIGGDPQVLAAALSRTAVGHLLDCGDAMIYVRAVADRAQGRVAPGWNDNFAGMLAYAKGKGWLDETGEAIQAHVEWACG